MKDKTYDKNERGLEVCQIAFRELVDKKKDTGMSKTAATKEAAKEADIAFSTAKKWYDPELAKRNAEKQAKRDAKKRALLNKASKSGSILNQVQTPGNKASKSGSRLNLLEQEITKLKSEKANLAKNLKTAIAYFKSGDSEQVDKLKAELKKINEREYQQGEILIKMFQQHNEGVSAILSEVRALFENVAKKF